MKGRYISFIILMLVCEDLAEFIPLESIFCLLKIPIGIYSKLKILR
jgi:hypothetical protein